MLIPLHMLYGIFINIRVILGVCAVASEQNEVNTYTYQFLEFCWDIRLSQSYSPEPRLRAEGALAQTQVPGEGLLFGSVSVAVVYGGFRLS